MRAPRAVASLLRQSASAAADSAGFRLRAECRSASAEALGASATWSPLEKSIRNLKIELDETPIGAFLELEGSPSSIDRVARLLGYTHSDYITQTYGALYIADSRLHGYKPTNMLFPSTKKLHEHALFP